ncbi:2-oxo-4-hydroxy-4-carboxy-5-ureidoimidazoline decarboxylase [Zhihengliuella flava]|uniref:2-oxo-4-hydroxy-4-carboxy-5-ureidoimidazoline decarboxylase n=1 Tax=Zhihengliuella flava TaxID=1285193 RepID=A0A931GLP2_9MICC|nr:2-oxo-4-hydroxy-4-carboxy-5-ureidoimidazoline decarboxylase [Zhihengliuella flava]MBG6084649.1 2-oxo-4-hydroxy-4-carboxy-5-ureidoimidazoline decarboxylase [Zhihengliuella flava]
MRLDDFNAHDATALRDTLRPCLDVDRWIDAIASARPVAHLEDLGAASRSVLPLTSAEIQQALAHHPRIGERADGASAEATFSRHEQSGVDPDSDVARRIGAGNVAYEQRFGRVFLIRAAGRSPQEILAELNRRLDNTPAAEERETGEQLCEIGLLRLTSLLEPAPAASARTSS